MLQTSTEASLLPSYRLSNNLIYENDLIVAMVGRENS